MPDWSLCYLTQEFRWPIPLLLKSQARGSLEAAESSGHDSKISVELQTSQCLWLGITKLGIL